VRVRVATQLDEQQVLDVLRADGEATGRQPSKARLAAVRATLRSPTSLTLVADDGGRVVGVLLAELAPRGARSASRAAEPGVLHLSLLCVTPGARRQGHGGALLRGLLGRFDRVVAWVPDGPARTLLERAGFVASGRTDDGDGERAAHLVHGPA